jgi:hypothetical protein
MNAEQADVRFPALGFTPDKEIWGFPDLWTLTSCGPATLKEDLQVGMELVGADGKRWRVLELRKVGRARPILQWLFWALLARPTYRVEQTLEALEPATLAEIKAKALASMDATSQDWSPDDQRESLFDPLVKSVEDATSVSEIFDLLGLDSFLAY